MTLPPVIRIFFAIDLPAETKERLSQFIGVLKKRSKSNGIRWTKPENLHITLQFLAEAKTEHITAMLEKVRQHVLGVFKVSELTFGSLHLFPNPYRPRVIVMDVNPQEALAALSGSIGEVIATFGYELEHRSFRAHLTLGRIKQPHRADLAFITEYTASDIESIPVREVALFRSEPMPEGSCYTVVDRIALG